MIHNVPCYAVCTASVSNYSDLQLSLDWLSAHCRTGCTAIVEVQQASTDTCSFFNQAYVLSGGEVVYHGGSNKQAMGMLGGSGMPCPPLYHPIEQYMRLIDPSFEVSYATLHPIYFCTYALLHRCC